MTENLSPEEKLLRLIRGGKKQEKADIGKEQVVRAPLSSKQLKPEKEAAVSEKPGLSLKHYLNKQYLWKALYLCFILSFIYFAAAFLYPLLGLRKIRLPEPEKFEQAKPGTIEQPRVEPLEHYEQALAGRSIFTSRPLAGGDNIPASVNLDLSKDINLVGIIAGDNPQAVIEDKKTQKTYYLTKGQSFGEFVIEDIQEGKVILGYRDKRFELFL